MLLGHQGRKKQEGSQVAEPGVARGAGVLSSWARGRGGGGAAGSAGQRRAANGCIAVTPAGPLGGTVTERTCGPSVVRREGRGCL